MCLIGLDPVHLVNLHVFFPSIVQVKLVKYLSKTVLLHHADILDLQSAVHVNESEEV